MQLSACSKQQILTHLFLMRFLPLSIGPVHFRFKGCWVVFFHFVLILIEPIVGK